jgi:type I restriction enzyme M protein
LHLEECRFQGTVITRVLKPRIGERIYVGAVGSAGFLCEAFDYLSSKPGLLTTKEAKTLQERTFAGQEKKSLAHVIAITNMILHGIEAPNIIHTNTLTENLADIQGKDRFDIVMANRLLAARKGKNCNRIPHRHRRDRVLFLQHFIKMLRAGGRGGGVIKNTFLSNTDLTYFFAFCQKSECTWVRKSLVPVSGDGRNSMG